MPTVFTHALVAGVLSGGVPAGISRGRLALVMVGVAILPDLDFIGMRLGIPYKHPLGHRGLSHSLAFAGIVALLAVRIGFPRAASFSRLWYRLVGLLFVACASHGFLDAFSDSGYGIGFFLPFSTTRYFFPFRPLDTSSIGITAFFQKSSIAVLTNEFLWVWLPVLLCVMVAKLLGGRTRSSR